MQADLVLTKVNGIVCTSQNEAGPDRIDIGLTNEFLLKAQKALKFIQENQMALIEIHEAMDFEFYQLMPASNQVELCDQGDEPNTRYEQYHPADNISGCHAKVLDTGEINLFWPFEHENAEIWIRLGILPDLIKEIGGLKTTGLENTTSVPVKYWGCYGSEYETVNTHQIDVNDQRESNGQIYVDFGSSEGAVDDMMCLTVEINTNPINGIDHVPCVHVNFDGDNLAVSLFKVGDKILVRPEREVYLRAFDHSPQGASFIEKMYWIEG